MTTPKLIGHPDWLQYNSSPLPVLTASVGPLSAGAFGPETISLTGGGAYLIVVTGSTPTDACSVDLLIQQYDVAGNFITQDFFGAVTSGVDVNIGTGTACGTLVRGNIYGPTLKISGTVAASAWYNSIFAFAPPATTTPILNIYVLPQGLGDPEPKLSAGVSLNPSGAAIMPGGLLMTWDNITVTNGTPYGLFPCCPYSGPATLSFQLSGASTSAVDSICQLNYYTVAGGTSAVAIQSYRPSAVQVAQVFNIDMPQMLCMAELINNNAAQTAGWIGTLTANNSA